MIAVLALLVVLLGGCIGSVTEDAFDAELERRRRDVEPGVVTTGLEAVGAEVGTDDPTLIRLTVAPPVVDYWVLDRPDGTARSWTWDGFDLIGPRELPENATADLIDHPFTAADVPAFGRLPDLVEEARKAADADEDGAPAILVADHGTGPRILIRIEDRDSWFRPDGTPDEAGP